MTSTFSETFERMLRVGGFKNGSEMAKALGVTPQAISNYKKKGELSAGFIIKFAELYSVSVDWLLTGTGEKLRPSVPKIASEICTIAMVETDAGAGRYDGAGPNAPSAFENAVLSPDEMIYVGKLLKLFRAPECVGADEVKATIDTLLSAALSGGDPSDR